MADHTSENWQFLKVEDVPEYMGYQSSYAAIINFAKEYGAVPMPTTSMSPFLAYSWLVFLLVCAD